MRPVERPGERGVALVTVLVTVLIVTVIAVSLVGLMNTDITHSGIQGGVARSFYIAQAGLEEAKVQASAAADPAAYQTPDRGVTVPYDRGQFTYWVDAGPAAGCGKGLKTLEAVGQIAYLGRTLSTRIRACGVPGPPFLAALFGVARVEFQGAASRTYLAPFATRTPGGGASLGSFTEINFADTDVRVNALSDERSDTVALRDGTFLDYALFGFSERPSYNPTPMTDPTPWILSAFGDVIAAHPTTEPISNRCGTPYACVTVGNRVANIQGIADLRKANYMHRVYMNRIRTDALPQLALDPAPFRQQAEQNAANAALNALAGIPNKRDSVYTRQEFIRVMFYLSTHRAHSLEGTVFVDGSVRFFVNTDVAGLSGSVTLAVAGDLIIFPKLTITIRHDLSTVGGRRTPGIVVFGSPNPAEMARPVCGQPVSDSGRLVMCPGSTLVVDGLIYTQDGMVMGPEAFVDQVGAMYHSHRGTPNPSFTNNNGTLVLRFDPLALSVFGKGIAIQSWQQLR